MVKKWYSNGAASKGQNPETLEKSRRFKEM
jgi:hypothetical protein